MLMVVVLLSALHLGVLIAQEIWTPPRFLIRVQGLLEVFGYFLLVLIGAASGDSEGIRQAGRYPRARCLGSRANRDSAQGYYRGTQYRAKPDLVRESRRIGV